MNNQQTSRSNARPVRAGESKMKETDKQPVSYKNSGNKAKQSLDTDVNKRDKSVSRSPTPNGAGVTNDKAKLFRANILALGTVFLLAVSNIALVLYAMQSKVEVIATTETGSIIKPIPLPQAFVTEPRVLSFVDECLRDSFSHDFENYRRTMNIALSCYTSAGGKEFLKAIDPTLNEISSKRVVLSVSTMPPALRRGPMLINGRATWEVDSVVTLFYQGTRERFPTQQRRALVTVVRVPLEENPRGISINAIQLMPYVRP